LKVEDLFGDALYGVMDFQPSASSADVGRVQTQTSQLSSALLLESPTILRSEVIVLEKAKIVRDCGEVE
jgi:hypothetical protein